MEFDLKPEIVFVVIFAIFVIIYFTYKIFFEKTNITTTSRATITSPATPVALAPTTVTLAPTTTTSSSVALAPTTTTSSLVALAPTTTQQKQEIKTTYDLIKYYCSENIEHFTENTENTPVITFKELYNDFLTYLPIGLKNLIYCNNNVVDNKDDVYNIIKCIRGQLAWWWVENAYGQTTINMEDINMVMLIIIWLLIMIEENINSVKDIMSYVKLTNQVIIKNNNLKKTFQESFSSDYYNELIRDKKLILDANNNYVIDIMLFHAMFKQYMYKVKDIKKTICDCKIQSISLTQAPPAPPTPVQAQTQVNGAQNYQVDLESMQQAQVLIQGAHAIIRQGLTSKLIQQAEALIQQIQALMQETQPTIELKVQLQALTQSLTQLQQAQEVAAIQAGYHGSLDEAEPVPFDFSSIDRSYWIVY